MNVYELQSFFFFQHYQDIVYLVCTGKMALALNGHFYSFFRNSLKAILLPF